MLYDMTKMTNVELLNWDCCKECDVGGMMQTKLLQDSLL